MVNPLIHKINETVLGMRSISNTHWPPSRFTALLKGRFHCQVRASVVHEEASLNISQDSLPFIFDHRRAMASLDCTFASRKMEDARLDIGD
jgi:hypothetical protein